MLNLVNYVVVETFNCLSKEKKKSLGTDMYNLSSILGRSGKKWSVTSSKYSYSTCNRSQKILVGWDFTSRLHGSRMGISQWRSPWPTGHLLASEGREPREISWCLIPRAFSDLRLRLPTLLTGFSARLCTCVITSDTSDLEKWILSLIYRWGN